MHTRKPFFGKQMNFLKWMVWYEAKKLSNGWAEM
jgi:hypothetical protein